MLTNYQTQRPEFLRIAAELRNIQKKEKIKLLAETQAALRVPGINIHKRLAFGNEAQEIVQAAKEGGADLIILGSKGRTRLRRLLVGSVSENVVHGAPCSVAVIRPHHT